MFPRANPQTLSVSVYEGDAKCRILLSQPSSTRITSIGYHTWFILVWFVS